jgi:CubicO group peptidase (beta-lactamase class C family)
MFDRRYHIPQLVELGVKDNYDSLLVVRHGKIIVEAYYAPYTAGIPHRVYSITKAVIGTLTAIAWKARKLPLPLLTPRAMDRLLLSLR